MAKRVQDLPNQSYKTQQDNESEVERIMRERGYERSSKTRHSYSPDGEKTATKI